jgi:hypothetical protein
VSALDIVRIENGRFIEHWAGPDLFNLLQQLGAVVALSGERKRNADLDDHRTPTVTGGH